jgi:ferritin-like metal-binding protein YciE
MNLDNLRDVYVDQLKDMYSAETQLTKALPKMLEAATDKSLKQAIQDHLTVTEGHLERVSQILKQMNVSPGSKKCKAMEGLVEEGDEMAKAKGDDSTVDAGIIAAAQKVEHYEIASYGTLRTWATMLGERQAAGVLEGILREEYEADQTLTKLAEGYLNKEAAS